SVPVRSIYPARHERVNASPSHTSRTASGASCREPSVPAPDPVGPERSEAGSSRLLGERGRRCVPDKRDLARLAVPLLRDDELALALPFRPVLLLGPLVEVVLRPPEQE